MRRRHNAALAVILALSVAAFGSKRTVVSKQNLGSGFQIHNVVVDLGDCQDCFEGLAHYRELWFRDRRLSEMVGSYSLSPSKRFALYEDVGKLMLFDAKTRAGRDVTDGGFAVPSEFHWDEAAKRVKLKYYGEHTPSILELPN